MGIRATSKEVNCLVRNAIPASGETILDDFDNFSAHRIKKMTVCYRQPEECPFGRGNAVVDLYFTDGELLCLKLPLDTPQDILYAWLKPILNHLPVHAIEENGELSRVQ